MSNPLDATPMQLREELAIVWSIVEQEKEFSSRLKKALTEREKQVTMLRDALKRFLSYGNVFAYRKSDTNPYIQAEEALAATEVDLDGLILCEKEPVGSMTICGKYEPLYRAAK